MCCYKKRPRVANGFQGLVSPAEPLKVTSSTGPGTSREARKRYEASSLAACSGEIF